MSDNRIGPTATKGREDLRSAMRQAMDIYHADAVSNVGEAMFEVLHAAIAQDTGATPPSDTEEKAL